MNGVSVTQEQKRRTPRRFPLLRLIVLLPCAVPPNGRATSEFFVGSHKGAVTAVAFAPDGAFLASGAKDATIKLWSMQTKRSAFTLDRPHRHPIGALCFSPDGLTLVSGDAGNQVAYWSIDPVRTVGFHRATGPVSSLSVSPDGKLLAIGTADGTLNCGRFRSGGGNIVRKAHQGEVTGIFWEPDNVHVVSSGSDGAWKRWILNPGNLHLRPEPGTLNLPTAGRLAGSPCALDASRRVVATAWADGVEGKVALHRFPGGDPITPAIGSRLAEKSTFHSLGFSHDGRTVAAGRGDGGISVWDVTSLLGGDAAGAPGGPNPAMQRTVPAEVPPLREAVGNGGRAWMRFVSTSEDTIRVALRRIDKGSVTGSGFNLELALFPGQREHFRSLPSGEYALYWFKLLEPGIIHRHPEPVEVWFRQWSQGRTTHTSNRSLLITLDGVTSVVELDRQKLGMDLR